MCANGPIRAPARDVRLGDHAEVVDHDAVVDRRVDDADAGVDLAAAPMRVVPSR
jgi:hypothetical protein